VGQFLWGIGWGLVAVTILLTASVVIGSTSPPPRVTPAPATPTVATTPVIAIRTARGPIRRAKLVLQQKRCQTERGDVRFRMSEVNVYNVPIAPNVQRSCITRPMSCVAVATSGRSTPVVQVGWSDGSG
jgi:hypothetical protein